MKRGLGVFDGSTSPARVWTLVVHNDFSNFGDDSRISDKEDVKILRDEFSRRNCEFRELASKSKDEILGVLNQENKLYEIFGADEKAQAPEAFVLFVLSHGTSDGRIYTDHLSADSSVEESKYEHYFTSDVWNGLHEKNMPKLSNCLKILVFGSCRGPNSELRLMTKTLNDCVVGSKSMWITAKPNSENFVIFYSTVEANVANSDEKGTWFVTEFCRELTTMSNDTDLIIFLNRVQRRVCARSTLDSIYAQTPQIQYFKHKKFIIYGCPVVEKKDGKCGSDSSQLVTVDRKDFYTWRSENMILFRRGRALIFHDHQHSVQAEEFQKSFQYLDFETEVYSILQLAQVVKKVSMAADCGLIEDGSLAICVLAKLREDKDHELNLKVSEKEKVLVNNITRSFIGTKSKDLAGKPKLFFFIDQGNDVDTLFTGKSADDFVVHGNNHGEIFVFFGVGCPGDETEENLVNVLARGLRDPKLKKGLSLQEAIVNIIRRCAVGNRVLPQVSSTLSRLLDFPPCSNAYIKPAFQMENYAKPFSFEEIVEQIIETAKCSGPKDEWRTRAWLLSSSAGLGKSAATKEMARQLREKLPDFLIVCIYLVKASQFLLNEDREKSDHRRLLSYVLDDNDVNIMDKIEHKKIIVLVDGFDEICPSYENLVLKYLRDMNTAKIPLWITTRVYREKSIRDSFNKLNVFDLVPMNKEEQIHLLRTLLYKNREECEDLLKRINKEFAATPLHLKMMAETADHLSTMEGGLHSLYYHFVVNKVRSAMLKFCGTDENAPNFAEVLQEKVELLTKVAMNYFFPDNLPSADDLRISNKDRINELGIAVVTFDKKKLKSIIFVHQTFAEFLVSLLFLSKCGHVVMRIPTSTNFLEDIERIDLSEFLLKNQFDQVRSFIDNYFEGNSRDEKVRVTQLNNACEPPTLKSQETDLMAFICKEGHSRLFQLLFEASFKSNFGDITKLVNTPFQYDYQNKTYSYYPLYAACFSSEDLALHLLDKCAKLDLLKPPECMIEGGGNILHLTAKKGLSNVTKRIIAALPELSDGENDARNIPLDIAAKRGHLDCVKVFIEACNSENKKILLRKRALEFAATEGHRDIVRFLMGDNLDVLKDKDGYPPIYLAARKGHVVLVEELIDVTGEVDVLVDEDGRTAVHAACSTNQLDVLILLHKKGANLQQEDKFFKHAPLHTAAIHNSLECCEYLLDQNVEINPKDKINETPYIHAASSGRLEVLKLLEKHNADIHAKSVPMHLPNRQFLGRMTALERAALHSEPECLAHLLDRDYSQNVKRNAFWIGLAHGARGDRMQKVLEVFLEKGFSTEFDIMEGKTAIVVLAKRCHEYWDKNKNQVERHPFFPKDKINREAPFYHRPVGITPAFTPIEPNPYLACITYLIQEGANVDHVPFSGGGAMHIAAENDDLILMNVLFKNNANPSLQDNYSRLTPLHYAAKKGQLKAVKFLLGIEGVEIDVKDATERTPLMLAVEGNHSEAARGGGRDLLMILEKFLPDQQQRGIDEALCGAVDGGHVDLVMDLFERGAEVSKRNKYFRSPLGVAIERNREELVRLLLSLMSHEDQTVAASSALIIAVRKGNLEIVNLLVEEFGADINVRDDSGTSAIMWAVICCASRIIDYLLQFEHLDLITPSNNGNAPLLFLFQIRDQEVQKRLESRIKEQMKTREVMSHGDL
ncbi:Hypothetical predicted protein [Cloeon dipterum]|uniref:Caspase family p20 domain-containing protein n=1 Tax=Cloeon dipterum TaxID=197152 RepID=A0A8S1DL22_9INSE|nr:Hypothetical predicted protein [Cloeon dipterum]